MEEQVIRMIHEAKIAILKQAREVIIVSEEDRREELEKLTNLIEEKLGQAFTMGVSMRV